MTQTTLFDIPSPPEAKRIEDHFHNGQTYAIAKELLENEPNWVKKARLRRAIKQTTKQRAGNFSARITDTRKILSELGFEIEWNGQRNEDTSAYRVIRFDVGLPEKVM